MTALQIARAECANYDNGKCLGFRIIDEVIKPADSTAEQKAAAKAGTILRSLRTVAGKPLPKCALAIPGIRCTYFEQCVAPMVNHVEPPSRKAAFEEALYHYRRAANVPTNAKRCRDCNGVTTSTKRLCSLCAEKRRLASNRVSAQQRRLRVGKTPSKTLDLPRVYEAVSQNRYTNSGQPHTEHQNALAEGRAAA